MITLFIIGYSRSKGFLITNKTGNAGLYLFVAGIIVNELFLMIQGISYMNYISVANINLWLLAAATLMFTGVLFMNIGQWEAKK